MASRLTLTNSSHHPVAIIGRISHKVQQRQQSVCQVGKQWQRSLSLRIGSRPNSLSSAATSSSSLVVGSRIHRPGIIDPFKNIIMTSNKYSTGRFVNNKSTATMASSSSVLVPSLSTLSSSESTTGGFRGSSAFRGTAVVAAAAATATLVMTTGLAINDNHDSVVSIPLALPNLVSTTFCDNESDTETPQPVEIDPYDNLPERDEPTHCSICLTYRQGPCRPFWRKVEACTKDNEVPTKGRGDGDETDDDDDDENKPDPPCLKYMMPWIECASGYRNLYALIELHTNYTEGIEDLEQTASQHLCWVPSSPELTSPDDSTGTAAGINITPTVDWSAWKDYVNVLNPDWTLPDETPQPKQSNVKKSWVEDLPLSSFSSTSKRDSKRSSSYLSPSATSTQKTPLWKTLDQSVDPELVTIEAKVPTIRESDVGGSEKDAPNISTKLGVMECAYAIDQDGHVLGFAYGVRPSDAVAGKTLATSSSTTSTSSDNDSQQDSTGDSATVSPGDEKSDNDDGNNSDGDDGSTVTMTIRLLPDRTRHVVIAASYTQVDSEGGGSSNDTNYESHVYKSKPMRLDEMAK